jgi:sigma-B regulation protein RsbU (phosphoserine phosphatase)
MTVGSRREALDGKFELGALFEFSRIVNESLDLKFILGHLLLTLMGKLLVLKGIVLLEKGSDVYRVENVKGLPPELLGQEVEISRLPKRLLSLHEEDARRFPWIRFFRANALEFLIPLTVRDKAVGIAALGASPLKKKLSQKELTYVKSLANIAAASIEKGLVLTQVRDVNRRLDAKIQELNTLFELSKEFNTSLEEEQIIKLLTYAIMGQVGANRYVVCLGREGEHNVITQRLDSPLHPDFLSLCGKIDAPLCLSLPSKKLKPSIVKLMKHNALQALIPLKLQNQTRGVLALGEKIRGDRYSDMDLEFLSSLGNLAIISLENARLFKEAIEKQKMEDELLIAREIQKRLLPSTLPEIDGFDIAGINLSSKQVGGDYYDFISLANKQYLVAIGDVSGKGTPASLLMANLQATIRALAPLGLPLSELTWRVNDLICDNTGIDRFITFFWGILDPPSGTFRYVNAGHNPPYVFRTDGSAERLDLGGLILGVMKTPRPYQEGEVPLRRGDVLVCFTDGVSEAMDSQGEEYGEPRIEEVLREHLGGSPKEMVEAIVADVKRHAQNTAQSDDITLVALKATK